MNTSLMTFSSSSVARPDSTTEGFTHTLDDDKVIDFETILSSHLNTECPMVRLCSPPESGKEGVAEE